MTDQQDDPTIADLIAALQKRDERITRVQSNTETSRKLIARCFIMLDKRIDELESSVLNLKGLVDIDCGKLRAVSIVNADHTKRLGELEAK